MWTSPTVLFVNSISCQQHALLRMTELKRFTLNYNCHKRLLDRASIDTVYTKRHTTLRQRWLFDATYVNRSKCANGHKRTAERSWSEMSICVFPRSEWKLSRLVSTGSNNTSWWRIHPCALLANRCECLHCPLRVFQLICFIPKQLKNYNHPWVTLVLCTMWVSSLLHAQAKSIKSTCEVQKFSIEL